MSRKKTPTETSIQQAYFAWVRLHPSPLLLWVHAIPNAGKRSVTTAQRAKAEGLTKGIADVFIPYPNHDLHGQYLEFKTPKGRQTPEQKQFQRWCEFANYGYTIVRSVDAAINVTRNHLDI